jgi:TetR/AcrR family transcriptional regulator, cholesterol catabolism regulator
MEIREKIMLKSLEKFLSLGIRNVTMDAIAAEAGVSKRTIYELFNDKEDLVVECISYLILKTNEENLKIVEKTENAIEAIFLITKCQKDNREKFTRVFIEDVKKYITRVNAFIFSKKENIKKYSAYYQILEKGIKQGFFRKDIRLDLVDTFMQELISFVHSNERINLLDPSDEDLKNNIFMPYVRGICTPEGLSLVAKYFEDNKE